MTEKKEDGLSRTLKAAAPPDTPAQLDARVFETYRRGLWRESRWRRLMTGSVRVPIPVALVACLLFAVTLFAALRPGLDAGVPPESTITAPPPPEPEAQTAALSLGFQPAKEMKVTILDGGELR